MNYKNTDCQHYRKENFCNLLRQSCTTPEKRVLSGEFTFSAICDFYEEPLSPIELAAKRYEKREKSFWRRIFK